MSKQNQNERTRAGFTLLELLVVIAIIVILSGVLFTAANAVRSASRRKATRMLIVRIEAAIDQYNEIYGEGWMAYTLPRRNPVMWRDIDTGELRDSGIEKVKAANNLITESILSAQSDYRFDDALVEVQGESYVVDPYYHADDPSRDLDNHMIWFVSGWEPRHGEIDIFSSGPNNTPEVLSFWNTHSLAAGLDPSKQEEYKCDLYRTEVGDDIVNWDTGK